MAEEIGVTICIGGSISYDTWLGFNRDAVAANYYFDDMLPTGYLSWSGTLNYGDYSDIVGICQEHGVTIEASSDAKYEIDATVTVWAPGMEAPLERSGDQSGDASISIKDLKKALESGRTLADLVAENEPFLRGVPALLIDGKPPTKEQLDEIADEEELEDA